MTDKKAISAFLNPMTGPELAEQLVKANPLSWQPVMDTIFETFRDTRDVNSAVKEYRKFLKNVKYYLDKYDKV